MLKVDFGEEAPPHETIPTPSFGLNYSIGGGLWTGRFHILWGNYSAGKSTLAFQMGAVAQKMGYKVVIIDAEQSFSDDWAERVCGLDRDKRTFFRTCIVEEILKDLIPIMSSEEKIFLIVDSINAIVSESFYKQPDAGKAIAIGARSRKYFLQKLAGYMDQNKIGILIAQQGFNPGANGMIMPLLGEAEKHWASNLIKLFSSGAKDDMVREYDTKDEKWGGVITDREIRWTIDKSKQRPVQGTKGAYWFSPQTGTINDVKEILTIATLNGIVNQKGAWYSYKDKKFQGFEKLVGGLDEQDFKSIKDELETKEYLDVEVNDEKLQQDGEE
jgi:RecA/RadA recombinase